MENKLEPKDSLAIIEAVINERKKRYEENGVFLIFWGILVALAGICQFIMLQMKFYPDKSGYVWLFTMVPGFLFTFFWKMREGIKKGKNPNRVEDWSDFVWLATGLLTFVSMFIVNNTKFITLVIFLPFCIAALGSALRLKSMLWVITSIISMVLAYSSVFFRGIYQLLFMAAIAILMFAIPGIQFYINHKKRNNV